MRYGKRGQITYEYLIIVMMVLLLVIPFFNYASYNLGMTMGESGVVVATVELSMGLTTVDELGPRNLQTIDMSKNIDSIEVTSDGLVTVSFNDKALSLPTSIPTQTLKALEPGSISLANNQGKVFVVNTPQITTTDNNPNSAKFKIYGHHFTETPQLAIEHVSSEDVAEPLIEYTPNDVYEDCLVGEVCLDVAEFKLRPPLGPETYTFYITLVDGIVFSNGYTVTVSEGHEDD